MCTTRSHRVSELSMIGLRITAIQFLEDAFVASFLDGYELDEGIVVRDKSILSKCCFEVRYA